ncbi:plasmid recombination protein [Lachnospiraceae bacterium DSM 108991]|uniref:Plasmid recombination protein n=1 Tax=Claveliimonas monacensis TaxID=2779351 RepID=A0ABR9RK61_9FIRM|nr:plasmid recombination protein [Claveliimonas monacensis]MBE5063353.1 plasmid recombination protein [Claveliimonas monacensis]
MTGKGSVNHNSRKFHAKNTDPKRSYWNVEYCNQDIREVYHELFDEALDRYNSKQTRKDRKIEDYYEKIRSGKQEKPFHEIILQIGDKDNMGATTKEGQMAARILDEYMKDFQRRNPTLRVFSAHLHMDEATPHLHIDFVPYTTGSKRGLDTRVSLKQALSALGFKGGTRMETELNQWVAAEKQQLASIMLDHGIEWEQKGTHEKHLSLLDFEKQERAKEVAALEEQKADLEEHNATMQEVNEKWLDHLKNIEQDISSARESWKEADKKAEQAKKNVAQYEKKLTEIAPMVKEMERFAEKYSADPEEVLPEAGTLETGKSYREKKAKPLIKKIVTVLRSVYRAYFDLSRRFNDIQRSYERAGNKVNSLTTRVEELWNENRMLRENLEDFERVKEALGHDTVKTIVQAERQREQALKEQKRAQRRKMDRGAR